MPVVRCHNYEEDCPNDCPCIFCNAECQDAQGKITCPHHELRGQILCYYGSQRPEGSTLVIEFDAPLGRVLDNVSKLGLVRFWNAAFGAEFWGAPVYMIWIQRDDDKTFRLAFDLKNPYDGKVVELIDPNKIRQYFSSPNILAQIKARKVLKVQIVKGLEGTWQT